MPKKYEQEVKEYATVHRKCMKDVPSKNCDINLSSIAKYVTVIICHSHVCYYYSEGTSDDALTHLLIVMVSFVTTILVVGGLMTIIF